MTPIASPADAALVLVVEDEPDIAATICAYLARERLRSVHTVDGREALRLVDELSPDLVLLDIQLPGLDGIDVLRTLRAQSDLPIIMLTAFVDDLDRLLGLRLGADDYITKPFVPAEVVARVRAVLRRCGVRDGKGATMGSPSPAPTETLRHGPLEIDLASHSAAVHGADGPQLLPLTLTEFRLLACLAEQPTRVFSREALIERCLPESEAFDRVIDSHLSKLRRKLAQAGLPELIATVRGVGYRLAGRP